MYRNKHYKLLGVLILALSALCFWYFLYMRPNHAQTSPDGITSETEMNQDNSNDSITAAGVTITEMDSISLPTDIFEDLTLYVEEVYLAAGDTVAAGQKCIQFTQDSIENARADLERAIQEADLAYRSKALSNGESSIQAKYTYDMARIEAEFAPQMYQDTLNRLELQLVKTENAYQKAQEAYNAYLLAVENNTFYDDFQIPQLKKAYYDAYDLYANRQKYWETSEEAQNALSPDGQEDYQWILKTLALLKEETEESRAEYELARKNYQSEIEQAEFKLHKLLHQLERAKQDYTDAQLAYQKESLHAKAACELSAASGEIAENRYNACLIRLANELGRFSDAKDQAIKNKDAFEQLVGDGSLYAQTPGTIAMLSVQKGQALTGGDSIAAYDNTKKTFVSVSIPHEAAAKLSVGGTAVAEIADYGNFDGVIETIQPVISEYSTVMVSLKGDVSTIRPNLTATVTFALPDNDTIYLASTARPVSQMYDFTLDANYPEAIEVFATQNTGSAIQKNHTDTNYLKIAEVYTAAGDYIEKGAPVCQFTQDSVENVRKALTYAQSETVAALIEAQADYRTGVLEAGLLHNEALLDMTLAQSTYDNTIAKLNSSITAKILETEELLTDIYQLQRSLTDDAYQKQQEQVTKAYTSAKNQLEQARIRFVTNQVDAVKDFQTAKESYETFLNQLKASNQQIEEKAARVYALQDEIVQSQQMLEKELIAAKQTYNSAQTAGEIAYATYTDSVKKYENAIRTAQARLDQTTQRLNNFEQFIGDGTIYATQSGLVVEVGYQKGDILTDTQKLILYVP